MAIYIFIFNTEQKNTLTQLVPQIVDAVLHHLFFSIEQEKNLDLTMKNSNGEPQSLKKKQRWFGRRTLWSARLDYAGMRFSAKSNP